MKLSEAMMLGSVTCKMVPGDWNSCGLGCSANAVGIANVDAPDGIGRGAFIRAYWPWLYQENMDGKDWVEEVYTRFDDRVCAGRMTLESLADYVRSVEPSCGDCNRFECSCVKSEAVPVTEEVTA